MSRPRSAGPPPAAAATVGRRGSGRNRSLGEGEWRREPDPNPLKLTPTDVAIIRCLQDDARSSIAKISANIRVPESTVRHRLGRLIQRGLLEFAAVTNPLQLGYQIWAVIEIQAEVAKVRSVARRLAAVPEVHFIGITTGSYDLLATAVFRSNEELLDFVTHRLARIKGIARTSTSTVLELVKRSLTFRLPDQTFPADGTRQGQRRRSPPAGARAAPAR